MICNQLQQINNKLETLAAIRKLLGPISGVLDALLISTIAIGQEALQIPHQIASLQDIQECLKENWRDTTNELTPRMRPGESTLQLGQIKMLALLSSMEPAAKVRGVLNRGYRELDHEWLDMSTQTLSLSEDEVANRVAVDEAQVIRTWIDELVMLERQCDRVGNNLVCTLNKSVAAARDTVQDLANSVAEVDAQYDEVRGDNNLLDELTDGVWQELVNVTSLAMLNESNYQAKSDNLRSLLTYEVNRKLMQTYAELDAAAEEATGLLT